MKAAMLTTKRRQAWRNTMFSPFRPTRGAAFALGVALAGLGAAPSAGAQWSTVSDQFYYPGKFNWQFRHHYPAADRLFNGFDFGHAILYETLWTKPGAPVSELEEKWYNRLTKEILVHPPRVPLEEGAIEIAYAKLAPEAKLMLDWAHVLHRQIYDVWADERIPIAKKDAEVQRLIRYYKTRPDIAFSSKPKTMELMEGQPYSTAFRKNYPKFNGLIWAYHWLQVGLYEPLLLGKNKDERQTGVLAAVARFRQMIEDPPTWMPRVMPMTPTVAPTFAARYAEAAIIFDNLHSLHDVISDILANPSVSRERKRAEILLATRRYRDDTSYVQTEQQWREMAMMMGLENMGGPVVGFLASFPQPTVERGAVMAGMDHANMPGMRRGQNMPNMPGMRHDMPGMTPRADTGRAAPGHAGHAAMRADTAGGDVQQMQHMQQMMELHMRMMEDPVIGRRVAADTAMRRMMTEMMDAMPAEHREHMEQLMREASATRVAPTSRPRPRTQPATRRQPAARPAARPGAKPADPHAGHGQPAAKPAARPATRPATRPAARPAAKPATKAPAKQPDPHAGHKPPGS
jgi:hypothetical protein